MLSSNAVINLDESVDISILLLKLFEDLVVNAEPYEFDFVINHFPLFETFLSELSYALSSEHLSPPFTVFKNFIDSNREYVDQLVYGGQNLNHDYSIETLVSLRKSVKNLRYKIVNFKKVVTVA